MLRTPSLPRPLPDRLVELIGERFRVLADPMRIRLLDRLREGAATDYTMFLLSSAKELWDLGEGAEGAMIDGVARSGRAVCAAAVMVAVFFTFALSGPLPPKEMGVILGIAVLLDAVLVRLLLVPVVLRLLGDKAWYLPGWVDRVPPDVRFGHA